MVGQKKKRRKRGKEQPKYPIKGKFGREIRELIKSGSLVGDRVLPKPFGL